MNRLQKQIIKDAIEYPETLTEWEIDFIDNIAGKDDNYELSNAQNSTLNGIGSKIA